MKIIVGLGNPGREYSDTRHNVGFMAIDALAAHLGIVHWKNKFEAEIADARLDGEQIVLVKPQTFMNLSGSAVGQLMRWYKAEAADIIAVYDDMDIPLGTAKLKQRGSSGGHRGVESLLVHIGKEEFSRVKIGIGRPPKGWTVVDHVLAKFTADEKQQIDEMVDQLLPVIAYIATQGIDKAMNRYNFKPKKVNPKKVAEGESEG